jgi:carbamoyltransferase
MFGKARPRDLFFFTKSSGYPSYFGEKPKDYEKLCRLNQHYADIAASIQKFTEEQVCKLAEELYKKTKLENLCIAGGVGLNSVANGILLKTGPFKNIFVQPAAGDDGGAMGAALFAYHSVLNKPRKFIQDNCYFGIGFGNSEIEKFLKKNKIKFTKIADEKRLVNFISDALQNEKVIGFFHGRAEWGPRALGARSIIASARREEMKEIVNTKIKFREPYRPFAPVVIEEKVQEYFEVEGLNHQNLTRFMLGVFPVKQSKKKIIPAVTHTDGSGRLQIINRRQNSRYYDIIKSFGDKTGVYVLVNTSFNLKGEPIVNTPEDALNTFKKSGLDILVLENYIILKKDLKED